MRIALFGKHLSGSSLPCLQELFDALHALNCSTTIYTTLYSLLAPHVTFPEPPSTFRSRDEIEGCTDFILSIGGDGTMLEAAGLAGSSGIPIAGINIGRLGFLSGISRDMILPAIKALTDGDFLLEERSLLLLESPPELFGEVNFALNDITVYKPNVMSMLTIKTWINGQFLNAYWADGLIIATPTGSTAYSLSCTGPILTPDSENFVITPIASHNLTVRPMVIRDDSTIRIEVATASDHYLLNLDSRSESLGSQTILDIKKAPFSTRLVRLREKHFFQTLREKLNWGLDNRN